MPVSLAKPGHPLVYLTLGTFSNNDLDLFRLVLEALEDEPVNVLATIGRDNDPSALAPIPENAHVERYIPQAEVLPYCTAVVHHAGAGTMFGVLAHGLPSVALPQSADNFVNANLLAGAGAARTLMPGEVTGDCRPVRAPYRARTATIVARHGTRRRDRRHAFGRRCRRGTGVLSRRAASQNTGAAVRALSALHHALVPPCCSPGWGLRSRSRARCR